MSPGRSILVSILSFVMLLGCGGAATLPTEPAPALPTPEHRDSLTRSSRLALWLAKKDELLSREDASYDLVMTSWFDPSEAEIIRKRTPQTKLLAGLTHTWTLNDPGWLQLLTTIANGGDPAGPLQVSEDMYLMLDVDGDGAVDRRCSLPGWDDIHAIDPRHAGWRQLIMAFYANVSQIPQHDGVVVDMVDATPFCEGAWSGGVPTPIDAAAWVAAQDELLLLIRETVPPSKWVLANAGRDFPDGSPFPRHLNGYVLENFLGSWGASLEEGLASAQRALTATEAPHLVVFAADTDDTGEVDWPRIRTGLAASLLMDNTYFAFDFGPRDHGGVTDWWLPEYNRIALGAPLGPYTYEGGVYRRDFSQGVVVIAADQDASLSFGASHADGLTGESGSEFVVAKGDARILMAMNPP